MTAFPDNASTSAMERAALAYQIATGRESLAPHADAVKWALEHGGPLSPVPEWKDLEPDLTASKPKPLADRQSYVQPVIIPMDWYVRLLEKVGDGWVSTYIKFLVWSALKDQKHKQKLSVPQRMEKFVQ